jgi:two-component system aerobic respiration control sensor histidine kinase ArcB
MTLEPAADGTHDSGEGLTLACLGHDLRAALAEMRSSLHLITGLDLPDHLRGSVNRCRAVGDDLSRLIDQSVLVCLGQASPVTSQPVEVDTAGFLATLRQRWTDHSLETGHSFHLIEAGDLPARFHIDRTALERVLANLIANALNHSPPGPVTVTFKASGGDLLLIAVEDEGPGFPLVYLGAIQRDFALPPEARRPGGGFGLQSVKLLVAAMGGRCNARNKARGGAEVSICLPLVAQAPAAAPSAAPPPSAPTLALPPDLTGTRLVMADDSASSRELVTALARHIGASILTVPDGRAALQELQHHPLPDVLILDDEMPGATGLEVMRWLQDQGGGFARLPVLALTSHIGADEVAALRRAGASEVLAKPVLCPLELGRAVLRAQGLGEPPPAPARDPRPELRSLARLRQIAGPEAAAELFDRLQDDLATARAGLARAAVARDLGGIRAHSHVIIALAGTAGAMALHEDAVTLNGMAHDNEPAERIIALAERLDLALGGLLDTVRQAARQAATAAPSDETSAR